MTVATQADYTLRVDPQHRAVVVVLSGVVDAEIGIRVTTEARTAASRQNFNVLYDVRGADVSAVRNADVFWWARNIPELTTGEAKRVRAAVIHSAAQRELAEFWENTYRNMGLQARAFDDEDAALRWLSPPSS